MKDNELWMSKWKEKLADYAEPTPVSGWQQLEKELKSPVEKKIYSYRTWMMAAAAVILLAVVSSLSLYFLGTPAADEIRHMQKPTLAATPDAVPSVQQPDVQVAQVAPVVRPVVRQEDRLAKVEPTVPLYNKVVVEDSVVKDEACRPRPQEEEQQPVGNKSRRPSGKDKYHLPAEKTSPRKGTWTVGLGVGNSGGASSKAGLGAYPHMSRVDMLSVSNGLMEIPEDQTLVFEGGVPYLREAKQVVDIKHRQPISFGLSVRKDLGKGFSLESGLTYTLLSSEAKLADDTREMEQKLHYVGIPLRANWNFLDKKLVTLYVSSGGMVEKCVYGKLGSEEETVKPLQFSVSGAVGAQLNVVKRVGVYVEPGVAYYFDDGSDIQTIRKENPFNFNVQAGIRLTY